MATNDTLASRKKQAEKLISEIEAELKAISSLKNSAKNLVTSISIDSKDYKKTINSLNRISSNIQNSIDKFNSEKSKVSSLLTQADRFYEKQYLPLKHKIENPNTGFKARIKDHDSLSRKLKKIELDCEQKYSEVKTIITDFKKTTRELRTLDTSIRNLHNSSSKNKLSTETSLTEIIKIEKRSIALNSNILKLEEKSSALFESIKTSEKDSKIKLNKIEEYLNTSDETLNKIQEIYDIAAETGRSGEFENRRNKLKKEVIKWERGVLIASSVLLASVTGLFVFQLSLLEWEITDLKINFYLRFILLSPLIYICFFALINTTKHKNYMINIVSKQHLLCQ